MTMPLALALRCLDTRTADFDVALQGLRAWSSQTDDAIETAVKAIVDDVRRRGDAAVIDCTRRFDALAVDSMGALQLSRSDFAAAHRDLGSTQRQALADAAARIKAYHARQLQATSRTWSYRDADGNLLGQKVTPLDRVGVYVPGGRAAYPSSLLMSVVPARVANVGEVIMMVPTPGGVRNDLVLAAAHIAGVDRAFTVGGAQAIAALAYGTASVPRVDKITGPGNAYVASAKKHVFGQVGIDMIAGPSEILVLADGSTPPDWVAMDLFSQAEHDELAQAILLTPDAAYLERVRMAIDRLLPTMPRAAIIRASLEGRGALVLTRSMEEACEIANRLAPEHLEVASSEPHRWEPLLRHAGAIFLGHHSSESLGDYAAGPNHVLPTAGTARFSSPLGVYDFVKRTSVIEISAAGAQVLGAVASTLAHGEGLPAHALAAEMRMGADALALTSGDGTPTRVTSTTVSPGERVLRRDIQGMHAYAVQPSAGMVKLDTMENPYRLPPALQAALGERLGHVAINRYPAERTEDLRQALARFAGMPEGCALTLGNGSDELISMLTMACDTPGACVMAPLPGFVMYEMSARMLGVRFIGVPLTNDFELDEAAMLAAIEREKPALLYLAYPNNPTANLWQAATIERLIQAMADVQGLVVMDEAYQPFASHDSMAWLQRWPHVLVMRTMSKFGLAGVRIGYLLGRRELIDVVDKLRPPFNVSVLNAEAALFALEHADEFARQAAAIRSERSRLAAALAALPGVNPFPSQANMILARVADSRRVFEGMRERRVLIKNVAPMHALLHGCIRITVGTPDENDQMLSALKASLP